MITIKPIQHAGEQMIGNRQEMEEFCRSDDEATFPD